MSLISELRRRNVIRVAMLYGVAAWVLLQVGVKIASARLGGHEPEFVIAVTPSR